MLSWGEFREGKHRAEDSYGKGIDIFCGKECDLVRHDTIWSE